MLSRGRRHWRFAIILVYHYLLEKQKGRTMLNFTYIYLYIHLFLYIYIMLWATQFNQSIRWTDFYLLSRVQLLLRESVGGPTASMAQLLRSRSMARENDPTPNPGPSGEERSQNVLWTCFYFIWRQLRVALRQRRLQVPKEHATVRVCMCKTVYIASGFHILAGYLGP